MIEGSDGVGRLTDEGFWDGCYGGRLGKPFDPTDWRNYLEIQLARQVSGLGLDGRRVLEIGGGDARLLAWLARTSKAARFTVLDFSTTGCELARQRAHQEGVALEVVQGDMFEPPIHLRQSFDVVFSHGLVEHFQDLDRAVAAKRAFLAPEGQMLTVIPNLESGLYAALLRRWSPRVADLHVVHGPEALATAHRRAGLEVVSAGYLGAVEFGFLSMALRDVPRARWGEHLLNLWLTRLSKAVHWFEYRVIDLPTSRALSPFLWVLARSVSRDAPALPA